MCGMQTILLISICLLKNIFLSFFFSSTKNPKFMPGNFIPCQTTRGEFTRMTLWRNSSITLPLSWGSNVICFPFPIGIGVVTILLLQINFIMRYKWSFYVVNWTAIRREIKNPFLFAKRPTCQEFLLFGQYVPRSKNFGSFSYQFKRGKKIADSCGVYGQMIYTHEM